MKKTLLLLSSLILIICSCEKELEQARIKGHIEGLINDTIYLYGVEDLYDRVDTVYLDKGQFIINLPIDTLTLLRMVVRDSVEYPLFIDKKEELTLSGSFFNGELNLNVSDKNGLNEEYILFSDSIANNQLLSSDNSFLHYVEQYILENNNSLISVYLLDTYFVSVPCPDYKQLKRMIDRMTGELKDRNLISTLLQKIDDLDKARIDNIAPFFTINMSDGVVKNRSTYRDSYLILHFWASWDANSRNKNKEIRQFYKKYKREKKLSLVSFSLDLDSVAWKNAIKEDSLVWDQASELKAWSSELVKQFSINEIPTLILINPQSKIIDREIEVNNLTLQLDSLLKE